VKKSMFGQQPAGGDKKADFVNKNLKLVFEELSEGELPDEIGDLLRLLKAQDEKNQGSEK
jgi:hypothetical protein